MPGTVELRDTVHAEDLRTILANPRDIELAAKYPLERFLSFVTGRPSSGGTVFEDGVPIIAGGLTRLEGNRALVWLIASKDLRPYKDLVVPEVQKRLQAAVNEGLTIYATVTPGLEIAERFIRRLGFTQPEGAKHWELKHER